MRTIRIKAYKFDELSKEAKETALSNYANKTEYYWSDDALCSLKKVADHFNSPVVNYSIDWSGGYAQSSISFDTEDVEFTAKELKSKILQMGSFNKETLKGLGDCKFTGYTADEDFCDGVRIAYQKYGDRNLTDLLDAGFNTWLKACQSDFEYQLSEEGYADHCEANDYEFTKEGKLI